VRKGVFEFESFRPITKLKKTNLNFSNEELFHISLPLNDPAFRGTQASSSIGVKINIKISTT
jgi:hypothetical protein